MNMSPLTIFDKYSIHPYADSFDKEKDALAVPEISHKPNR